MRVLRLRMLAVKNSMKRRLARSPWARTIAGSASIPARISAGGGLISSVKRIGAFDTSAALPGRSSFLAHKADYVLQTPEPRGQGNQPSGWPFTAIHTDTILRVAANVSAHASRDQAASGS